jgi:hypothetical protein
MRDLGDETKRREDLLATLPPEVREALPLHQQGLPLVLFQVLNALHAPQNRLESVWTFSQVLPPALMQAPAVAEGLAALYGAGTPPGQAVAAAKLRAARQALRFGVNVHHLITERTLWGLPEELARIQEEYIGTLVGHGIRLIPALTLAELDPPDGFAEIPHNILVIKNWLGTCALTEETTRIDWPDGTIRKLDGPAGIFYPPGSDEARVLAEFRVGLEAHAMPLPSEFITPLAHSMAA